MMRRFVVIPILFCLAAPTPVLARGLWGTCQIRTLCAGVQPGGGRIINCLRDHETALSQACYVALGHWKMNWRPRGQATATVAAPAATAPAAAPATPDQGPDPAAVNMAPAPKANDAAPAPQ